MSSILQDSAESLSESTDKDTSRSSSTRARKTHESSRTDVKISHLSSRTFLPGDLLEANGSCVIVLEETDPQKLFVRVLKLGKEVWIPRNDTKVLDT